MMCASAKWKWHNPDFPGIAACVAKWLEDPEQSSPTWLSISELVSSAIPWSGSPSKPWLSLSNPCHVSFYAEKNISQNKYNHNFWIKYYAEEKFQKKEVHSVWDENLWIRGQ